MTVPVEAVVRAGVSLESARLTTIAPKRENPVELHRDFAGEFATHDENHEPPSNSDDEKRAKV